MNPIRVKLEELKTKTIPIGREGENNYTVVSIDCSSVFKKHPAAVTTMRVKPPKGLIYPVTVTQDGTDIIWTVKDSDLACKGDGQFQLTFTEDTVICKSVIGRTLILKSLKTEGPAPDPIQDWLEEAEEALEELEAAEVHQPTIGEDGYWYTWDQEAGEYQKTETKAQGEDGQPGQDGHTPEKGVDYWTAADKAEIESDVAGAIIDDTSTALDKVWSASKSGELLNAINGKADTSDIPTKVSDLVDDSGHYTKPVGGIPASDIASGVIPSVPVQDVQVNGNSVLSQGVANIPMASESNLGAIRVNSNLGTAVNEYGELYSNVASNALIKQGTNAYRPIVPSVQDVSVFYGLAKLAGENMSGSSNPVGQFTDAAKVAIQKMLGIYEAPWELIREDTVTLATKGNIEIAVDSDGNQFELTDVYCTFGLPQQENEAKVEDYGRVKFFIGSTNALTGYIGAWTQAAGGNPKSATILVEQSKNTIYITSTKNTTDSSEPSIQAINARTTSGSADTGRLKFFSTQQAYTKIVFEGITGTAKYRIYGKRKWN